MPAPHLPEPPNMTEWTSQRCLDLIKAYEEHPMLWNQKDGQYYDRAKKTQAWADLAQELDTTQHEVRKKLDSLMASFRREKSKERKSKEPGGRPYKSDWYAYKSFAFLLNRDDPKESGSTNECEDMNLFYCDSNDNNSETTMQETRKRKTNQMDPLATELPKKRMNSQDVAKEDIEIQNICGVWQPPSEEDDPTVLFGKYLGKKLNQFDPRTRATLTHKINQLLFEAEMSIYDNE